MAEPIYSSNPSATNPAKDRFIATQAAQNYSGPSVVDFLGANGTDSSLINRTKLATQYGVEGYTPSAEGNTRLLNTLRGTGAPMAPGATPAVTPAVPAAPVMSAEDQAFETYLKTLSPTAEENAARTYLNNVTSRARMANENAGYSGETMGFASGEQQRVSRNNALTVQSAADVYNSLKSAGDTTRSVSEARYKYTSDKAKEKTAAEKEAAKLVAENTKPFELSEGQTRYTFNPKTGKYEATASVGKTYKAGSDSSESKMTEAEKKASGYSIINQLLTPGQVLPDGTPVLDANGFITKKALQIIKREAVQSGINANDFEAQYADSIFKIPKD